MAETTIDQEQADRMRLLLARDGEQAVADRYGEGALNSAEYAEAQRRVQAQWERERQLRQEAFIEGEQGDALLASGDDQGQASEAQRLHEMQRRQEEAERAQQEENERQQQEELERQRQEQENEAAQAQQEQLEQEEESEQAVDEEHADQREEAAAAEEQEPAQTEAARRFEEARANMREDRERRAEAEEAQDKDEEQDEGASL
ncbi:hypothetical protein [Rothia halotolerans]|uniref:hypothetical protein n=1 Tax=Rothia halotolerans TaxID=405770 RepID=UPI00101D7600|nr:hypothetical protein [Rothia halotolerans]